MNRTQQRPQPQPRPRRPAPRNMPNPPDLDDARPLPAAPLPGNEQFRNAAEAYDADQAAAWRARQDTIDEAWADYRRKKDAAEADYDRRIIQAAATYEQRLVGPQEAEAS